MTYTINHYRARKFGNNFFVTTDHGSYCILSEEEFKKLQEDKISGALLEKLEEREVVLSSRNLDETIRLMRNRNSFLFLGTSLHIVVVTLRCNMKCVYCHASSKSEQQRVSL